MRKRLKFVWPAFFITIAISMCMLDLPSCEAGYERYAGSHPLEILHKDACVREKFQSVLGDHYQTFLRNLEVSRRLVLINGWLVSDGRAQDNHGDNSAIFCLDICSGKAYAAVFSKGIIVHYYGADSLRDLPEPVTQWALHRALLADPFHSGSIWTKGRL